MYITLAIDDRGLTSELAHLIGLNSIGECGPKGLALLFSIQNTFECPEMPFNSVQSAIESELDRNPSHTLRRLKVSIQRMAHRLVQLDEDAAILISTPQGSKSGPPYVGVISRNAMGSNPEGPRYEASVLDRSDLRSFLAGMEDAATNKVADSVLNAVANATDPIELLEGADLPELVAVIQILWKAYRKGDLTEGQYEQVASRLLRVGGSQILRASLAFTIPGVGPALSALLFSHRIEQYRA